MRSIVENHKASTTLVAIATVAAVLLSTGPESTLANAKSFSNSGNYLITDQNCTAGNSCNLSSSNTITPQSAITTPSPNPSFSTRLSLTVSVANKHLTGFLQDASSGEIIVQDVPLTITFTGTGVPANLATTIPAGQSAFYIVPFEPPTVPGTYTVQAHFPGATLPDGTLLPSNSQVESFTIS